MATPRANADPSHNGHVHHRDIIVIGASAGGLEVLKEIAAGLPTMLDAALFVVLHIPPTAPSVLPVILTRAGKLPAITASDGTDIRPGRVYVAPPDHHLLLRSGQVRVVRGPQENGHRPAIDPLFRSAALYYGPRVIGVVLSGNLDDGTAGLEAVHAFGGVTVVQDPDEAMYPDMPRSAVRHAPVHHIVKAAGIAPLLVKLSGERVETPSVAGPLSGKAGAGAEGETGRARGKAVDGNEQRVEDQMATMDPSAMHRHERPGEPSAFACPECGGVLFELSADGSAPFRCRVGHAYSPQSLLAAQSEGFEAAMWSALRALEEHSSLLDRMSARAMRRADEHTAARFQEKARSATSHADTIRKLLLREAPAHEAGAQGGETTPPTTTAPA